MARDHVGIFDGSPLGKIEVMGPDAAAFLNFVYYNTIMTLKAGKLRYGFMLTETGIVYDDGVVACMGPNRYIISCSSSHVDGVRAHLEAWRQDGNDPDRIFIHDTTQAWTTVTVTGPKARETLSSALALDIDLSQDALPHMSLQETTWQGHKLRIARVSFSGDLSYEISVTASKAKDLWGALMKSAIERNGGPLGLEAMSILRAEKGYIIIGKDTDGETMPHDLGFSAPRAKKSAAYIGDRSLQSAKANDTNRKMLVGIKIAEGAPTLPTGAHIVAIGADTSQGYVTSSYDSPTLGHGIALAIVNNGANRHGEMMETWHMGKRQAVTLCAPCVYDLDGEKLHA